MNLTECSISCDPNLLDLDAIHAFLATSYWSPGIARSRLERAIRNSLCLGVYDAVLPRRDGRAGLPGLVGFGRLVTDRATFAYLCDVFILESHRGCGLSKRLVQAVIEHPELRGIRRLSLFTRDAHGLYARFGFEPTADPTRYMERLDRESYRRDTPAAHEKHT